MAAILTAAAAKDRDKRLAQVQADDAVIDGQVAAIDDIICRARGVAPSVRDSIVYLSTNAAGVCELPVFTWSAAALSTSDARTVVNAVLNGTTTVTSSTIAFTSADVGRLVVAEGVPAGTIVATVTNSTTAVLSAAATESATGVVLVIGDLIEATSIDHRTGRVVWPVAGDLTVAVRHGQTPTPTVLLDAATEYVLAMSRYHDSRVSRDTISVASEAGTTRNSTPDWPAGRFTGFTEVDRLISSAPDFRIPGIG